VIDVARRIARVRLPEWPGVLMTLLLAAIVELGLRVVRLPRLAQLLGVPLARSADAARLPPSSELRLPTCARRRLAFTSRVMKHWPCGDTCLRVALVAGARIRRLRPELVIGVAVVDGEVKAHAWLTIDGISIDPGGSPSFAVLTPMAQ